MNKNYSDKASKQVGMRKINSDGYQDFYVSAATKDTYKIEYSESNQDGSMHSNMNITKDELLVFLNAINTLMQDE